MSLTTQVFEGLLTPVFVIYNHWTKSTDNQCLCVSNEASITQLVMFGGEFSLMAIVLSLLYTPLISILPLHTHLPFLFPLFSEGSHTLSKTVVTSSGGFGMMAKFTKKKSTCIGCRAVLEREGEPWEVIFELFNFISAS